MTTDKGGRPRIIDTPEEFDEKVNQYVQQCAEKEEPLTITGLALALGFCDKQSLYDYEDYEGFSCSTKRARMLVENGYEKLLSNGGGSGPIFALKNFGWKDKSEVENSGGIIVRVKEF